MGVFFISDLHLGHERIIKLCDRPFDNLDTMHNKILFGINCLSEDDDLVVVGDVINKRRLHKITRVISTFADTPCRKYLVLGNHDDMPISFYINEMGFFSVSTTLDMQGSQFRDETINSFDRFFFCHDPTTRLILGNDIANYDAVIHGHVHNLTTNFKLPMLFSNTDTPCINVSVELTSYTPVPIEVVYRILRTIGRRKWDEAEEGEETEQGSGCGLD